MVANAMGMGRAANPLAQGPFLLTPAPTMALASKLLLKLSQRLWPDPADQEAFVAALTSPRAYPGAILWTQPRPQPVPFSRLPSLPWQPPGVDRLEPGQAPGQHPLHHQGAYYCLDMASVFAAAVLTAIPPDGGPVLDLCAAPGGKSLLARHLLQPDQLWCNEVIRKRVRVLIANLKRCGATEAVVFNLNPQVWADQAPQGATVVLVDAPCSGQSLLAKGDAALGCFHPQLINRNAGRQRRILAAAAASLAPGGYLAYMTCTFSPEENEQVGAWLLRTFPQLQPIAVPLLQDYQSSLGKFPCYRLWPQTGLGAGAFTALFQKQTPLPGPEDPTSLLAFLDRYGWPIYPPEPHRDGPPADAHGALTHPEGLQHRQGTHHTGFTMARNGTA